MEIMILTKRIREGSRQRETLTRNRRGLLAEEQCVKRDRFGQRHADDGLHEDLAGSCGIAADALDGFSTDETDTDRGRETAERALNAACDFSDLEDHGISIFCLVGFPSCARLHAPDGK